MYDGLELLQRLLDIKMTEDFITEVIDNGDYTKVK